MALSQQQNLLEERVVERTCDREKTTEALQQSEEKYRILFMNSPDAYLIIVDGIFVDCNRAAETMLRGDRAQIIGTPPADLSPEFQPDGRKSSESAEEKITYALQKGLNMFEWTHRRFDGSDIIVEVSIAAMTLEGKSALFTAWRDISLRKEAEQELQDKNSELERFTYTVSHDLKSPLITINTFAGMILQDLQDGVHTRIPEDLARISDAATRMGMLLDDLLQLSRIGRMINTPSRIDMNALAGETLAMLEGTISQQQIEIVVQPDLPDLFGDRQRIGMVLQNLLENALKYMGNRANPRIEIGADRTGLETVFFVNDNGIGIDPHQHENIFGLFKQLDTKSQGTGIGLALAKRIIELHGGRIWVESEGTGTGSTFYFWLPQQNNPREERS